MSSKKFCGQDFALHCHPAITYLGSPTDVSSRSAGPSEDSNLSGAVAKSLQFPVSRQKCCQKQDLDPRIETFCGGTPN